MEWQVREGDRLSFGRDTVDRLFLSEHYDKKQNESSELKHYGVKGMRWGIRKDYEPTGRKGSKQSELRLTNAVDKVKRTDNGDSVIHINDKSDYDLRKKMFDKYGDLIISDYASESEALYKLKTLPRYNMRLSQNQQATATNHDAPNYDRTINCFECTMAYEMRRRGYNVQANENHGGYTFEALHAFDVKDSFKLKVSDPEGSYLSNKTKAEEAYRRLEEQCLSYGDGARGMMGIYYAEPYDGGHALSWVVENGKFKILDNQDGARTEEDIYDNFLYCDSNIDVYRLDNADVLPGVTDFVEPFEATDKEKKEAEDRYKRGKKIWTKEHVKKGKSIVDKIIGGIKEAGKKIGEFVSKGMEVVGNFLKNPLNIKVEKKETTWRGNAEFTRISGSSNTKKRK